MLSVKQVADRLQISKKTVYQLCAEGRLAHHRIGVGRGTIRIGEADLATFIEGCRVAPGSLVNAAGLKHIRMPSAGSPGQPTAAGARASPRGGRNGPGSS